ncbi:MAG: hypothetical protein B6D59_01495 [Campylobacteraceae bacterium 4484_4]|nr:MAG: hypothetical protein B6D59_01495 [Campylobacteraceae bacterium 4484_4]
MRLFLASFATIPEYAFLQKEFEHSLEGKWVEPENLHYTLWFFGQQQESESIIKKLRQIHFPHQRGIIQGLGIMGGGHRKILYAKLRHNPYKKSLQALGECFGMPRRPFNAHVTLLRIKRKNGDDYHKILRAWRHREIGFTHGQVALISSQITETGPIYTPLVYF